MILGQGAVEKYLESPDPELLANQVLNAKRVLEDRHDVVIYEGTGHPSVGSVVGLSNARVAKMLNAGVIMIVEGVLAVPLTCLI